MAKFPVKKRLWPVFSRFIGCGKPQKTFCWGPKVIVTTTVEVLWSLPQHLRGCWKRNILKRKGIVPHEKRITDHFFSFYRVLQTWRDTSLGSMSFFDIYCEVIGSFLYHLRGCWKHKFLKKRQHFQCKKNLIAFSLFIEYEKPHESFYGGQKGTPETVVQLVRSFRQHLRGCWKQKFL